MIEIRKLKKDDMEEPFDLLNTTFGTKYGRPMHFDLEQPKMWVKDDLFFPRDRGVDELCSCKKLEETIFHPFRLLFDVLYGAIV
jgi:hypothetical protein